MKNIALLSVFAVLILGTLANAQCPSNCLFYGGDFDENNPNANALANESDAIVSGNPYGAATYQNFTNSQTWTVTNMFTDNLSGLNPSTGYWEIRTGVSEGNGGTLIASGTAALTHTLTGRIDFGFAEYRDEVDGLNLTLNPGTYWMAVVPQDLGNANRSFNTNTFGLNAVGIQTSNQQFFNSSFFGANFTNANNEGVFQTFSSGVIGTAIPEPSSVIMLGSGLVAAAGIVRRRVRT
jgi:PEP-CTERM motif